MEKTLNVGGMTCAACARHIERALYKLPGLHKAFVNLAAEKAVVSYDAGRLPYQAIQAAIEKLGYRAQDAAAPAAPEADTVARRLWRRFGVAAVFCAPLVYVAMAPMLHLYVPEFIAPDRQAWRYAWLELFLALPVLAAGYELYVSGFRALRQLSPNMNSLVALGTSAAMLYSLYSVWQIGLGHSHAAHALYFESAGVIITLVLLGKALEALSKKRTSAALQKLLRLAPQTARLWQDGQEREIPLSEVKVGDVLAVKPGGRAPVDGLIIYGQTAIDESMLTGESIPVNKQTGDKIYASTLNIDGFIRFQATKVGQDTVLAQIVKLVETAQGSRAPIAGLADTVSGYFVPVVCLIALLAGIAWLIGTRDMAFALSIFIAVLVIACPCALGLATPTAIMIGAGKGAEYGILIKNGAALEALGKVNIVALDKTGTLTAGQPSVTDINVAQGVERRQALQVAASVEKGSEHPLGQAIVRAAAAEKLELLELNAFQNLAGRGVAAQLQDAEALVGTPELLAAHGVVLPDANVADRLAGEGKTAVHVALNGRYLGSIALADELKPGSKQALVDLRRAGLEPLMLTGDNARTAAAVAAAAGIAKALAGILPQDKAEEIKKLQAAGHKVAMVGDGVNDAPALAQADVGIAIGSGTDVAVESADIVLMRSDLRDVLAAVNLSRQTMRNIRQNLIWAFGYNIVGIPVAAGAWHLFGGPLLNPMLAAAAMSLSSISVVANALRLRRWKPK